MKKRMILLVTLITALFIANGCIVTSLNPLYTEETVVFEEGLVGQWKGEGDDEIWSFEKGEKDEYRFIIYGDTITKGNKIFSLSGDNVEEKNTDTDENTISIGKFNAHLVKLGDQLFLDMYPVTPEEGSLWYFLHTVPVHSFMKVGIEGDTLNFSFLNLKWFGNKIDNGEDVGIDYVLSQEGDVFILSAPTDKLQAFMLKNAGNEEIFDDEEVMTRYK